MKAPVWHLIARIDLVGGSTGWHRYQLIDRSIKRFGEWWLLGTDSTAHWGHITTDITNQYVLEGVSGGIVTLVLFVAMIVFAYKGVGTLCRIYRRSHPRLILSWAFGVSLLAHTMMFMAVSYFGQIIVVWYLLLAMIASMAVAAPVRARRSASQAARSPSANALSDPTVGSGRRPRGD
jgi:hypothetical protein